MLQRMIKTKDWTVITNSSYSLISTVSVTKVLINSTKKQPTIRFIIIRKGKEIKRIKNLRLWNSHKDKLMKYQLNGIFVPKSFKPAFKIICLQIEKRYVVVIESMTQACVLGTQL